MRITASKGKAYTDFSKPGPFFSNGRCSIQCPKKTGRERALKHAPANPYNMIDGEEGPEAEEDCWFPAAGWDGGMRPDLQRARVDSVGILNRKYYGVQCSITEELLICKLTSIGPLGTPLASVNFRPNRGANVPRRCSRCSQATKGNTLDPGHDPQPGA